MVYIFSFLDKMEFEYQENDELGVFHIFMNKRKFINGFIFIE